MQIVSDHGFPKANDDESAFDAFKNEREYIAQSGRLKTTVAAMDWAMREIERLTAENERLRLRNAALVEALRDHRCPADYRISVAECAKTGTCGCCDGILIGDALNQQLIPEKETTDG